MARGEFPFYCNISKISFDKFFDAESSNGDTTTNVQIAHSYRIN